MLGVPILAGRDFTDEDRDGTERVAIVSQSMAQRLFPNGDALNRRLSWARVNRNPEPRRIVGIVADVDDQNVVQEPTMTVYVPLRQMGLPSRLFVRAAGDPYALVPSVMRTIRGISADQAVERPTTLEDVRAEVLSPERLNAFVFSAFGGIALLIAVVGVAGVLAFSVSARTREFGIRLAVGSTPRELRAGVLRGRRADCGDRDRRRGGRRLRAGARGGGIFCERATAGRAARDWRSRRAHRRGDRGVTHAGQARVTCRCLTGASIGVTLSTCVVSKPQGFAAGTCSSCSLLPLPFRLLQPLRHLLVLLAVARPTLCSAVPAVVLDGHVDAAVDEELHRLVVPVKDQMVQDARRLMGVPGGVDVGAVLEEEVRHVEVTVDDGPGERRVEHLLRSGRAPLEVRPRARGSL